MLNRVAGVTVSSSRARSIFRLRPHPAAVVPWLFAATLVWYALPRVGFFPAPGTTIRAHYPEVFRRGLVVLAVYWLCAALFSLVQAARRPPGAQGRLVQVLLSIPLMLFAVSYGAVKASATPADSLFGVLVGAWLWCVLLAASYHHRAGPMRPLTGLALSLAVAVPLGFVDTPVIWPSPRDVSALRAPDGRVYHVQRKSQMQARVNMLTEEIGRDPFFLHTRVIGVSTAESGVYLVRAEGRGPDGPFDPHGQLVLAHDSRLLLFVCPPASETEACYVYLAYDLRRAHLYADGAVGFLSPFILIGPDDVLRADDLARLRKDLPGYLSDRGREALASARVHPNPRVRALVGELLAEQDGP